MANLRNEFEFRSALLTALGQEHTEAEAKNEDTWRRKMLDGLGVEYDQNDVNQFGLFREKLIEGVTNYSGGGSGGGGGETWNTVFDGNVTTEAIQEMGVSVGDIEGFGTTADSIKVTFNGVEYLCEKNANGGYGATNTGDAYDWSEYPFEISSDSLFTQTAGTYSLKIEEPSSGGSSDFSTAQVTVEVTGDTSNSIIFEDLVTIMEDSEGRYIGAVNSGVSPDNTPQQFTVILLDGDYRNLISYTGNISVSGSAELLEGYILIHGDCTITIS